MERRFRIRLEELLNDAEVRPSLLNGVMPRLEAFLLSMAAKNGAVLATGTAPPRGLQREPQR